MLSRRHLRIKVLQAVYAYLQSGSGDLAKGEKQLNLSIEKIRELIIYQLSFLLEIRDFTANLLEERTKKYFPTEEDLNPNFRFVENRVLAKIADNRAYRKLYEKYRINWADEQSMVRKAYLTLAEKGFFKKYMEKGTVSFEDDREMLIKMVKKILEDLELLEYFYESKSVFWAFDSYHIANLLLMKYLRMPQEDDDEYASFPEIFDESGNGEDRAFMIELFRKTILTGDRYDPMIDEKASNWELERIALMDTLLIKMALVELIEFPSIPIKVTLNEYIDISKYYSSAKSKVFINGVLDKLIVDLKEKNMIRKTGRGLME